MPRMDQAPAEQRLLKLLIIGDGKMGKTHYAGEAAGAGFNVLYMDGDVGAQTLAMLPANAQERIYLMDVRDTVMGGIRETKFIENFVEFCNTPRVRWNDSKQRIYSRADKADVQWEIRPDQMGPDTIFVLDSWTGLTESMTLKGQKANNIPRVEEARMSQLRPVYQSAGLMATTALQLIRALKCHVIVIGHPDEYQHLVAPEGRKVGDVQERDLIIEWTKRICKSTSKPHGLQIAKYFTDIAWMEVSPAGERRLDFTLKPNRIGGGHFNGCKSVTEYSFANLVKQIGGFVPPAGRPVEVPNWLTIIPPANDTAATESTPAAEPVRQVLDGTQGGQISGLASMFAKKPAVAG
jgi:hypothetical protein